MNKFEEMHLAEDANIISRELPGKRSQELIKFQKENEGSIVSYPRKMPIAIKRAKGAIIEDVDGNQFIDFFAGCGVLNVGHSNEEVLSHVKKQMDDVIHVLDFPTETKMNVIKKIKSHLPDNIRDDFKVSFGGPTGSDAVESAIKLAKLKTGRSTIMAFSGGYHGMTSGALAVTSDLDFRRKLTSLIPNVHFVPFNYPYRGMYRDYSYGDTDVNCLSYFKYVLTNKHSGVAKPAAIILEPIQGEGGNIVPEKGFLEELVRIAHENDVLVIFDEIQSGFFRTGEFLSFMHTDAVPDIITISKGIGGVGLPLAGLIYKKEVEAWGPGGHIGTFRCNQASLAGAYGAFEFIEKYDVKSNATKMGDLLQERLKTLQTNCSFIGDVRGKGLMIGVEIVKDKTTKEPFPGFVAELRKECFKRGLLFEVGGHYNNVLRIVPPLTITPKIIDSAIKILEKAIEEVTFKYQVLTEAI